MRRFDSWIPPTIRYELRDGAFACRVREAGMEVVRLLANGMIEVAAPTGEVQNCDIWKAEQHITPLAVEETNAKVFPAGTLLIAMYGEGKTRGQIGRLRIEAATNQASAALVNPMLPVTTNEYVFYFALSEYHRMRAEAVGGNQPNLSLGIIKEWEVNLPPLDEQAEIVKRIEAMFALAERIEAAGVNS